MRFGRWTAAALACVLLGTAAAGTAQAAEELRVRKEVSRLNALEKQRFVAALHQLKQKDTPYPGLSFLPQYEGLLSWYDQFVLWHLYLSKCDPSDRFVERTQRGHAGPVFLPWHRQFLLLLEDALREVSGRDITVPYWDWTNPESTRAVFSDDFMGGSGDPAQGYAVTTGPFRAGEWRLLVQNEGIMWRTSQSEVIKRRIDFKLPDGTSMFPAPQPRDLLTAARNYDVDPFDDSSDTVKSFRNALEGFNATTVSGHPDHTTLTCGPDGWMLLPPRGSNHHNRAHTFAGGILTADEGGGQVFGTLTAVPASPNDPAFFLIHSNVDRLWAAWQRLNPNNAGYGQWAKEREWQVDTEMKPFDDYGIHVKPSDVLDIAKLGYTYSSFDAPTTAAPKQAGARRARSRGRVRRARARATLVCRIDGPLRGRRR